MGPLDRKPESSFSVGGVTGRRRSAGFRGKDDRATLRIGAVNTAIMRGEMDLTAWSDEELLRGQQKNKNGQWTGRPPSVVPTAVHQELARRRMSKAYELLRENVVGAVEVAAEVMTNKEVDNGTRLKAAELIINRVLGKLPEHVTLEVAQQEEPAFKRILSTALVMVPTLKDAEALGAGQDGDVVEGELVEDEVLDDTVPWDS